MPCSPAIAVAGPSPGLAAATVLDSAISPLRRQADGFGPPRSHHARRRHRAHTGAVAASVFSLCPHKHQAPAPAMGARIGADLSKVGNRTSYNYLLVITAGYGILLLSGPITLEHCMRKQHLEPKARQAARRELEQWGASVRKQSSKDVATYRQFLGQVKAPEAPCGCTKS